MGDSELKNLRFRIGATFSWKSKVLLKHDENVLTSEGVVTDQPNQFEKGDTLYIRTKRNVLKFEIERVKFNKVWSVYGHYCDAEEGVIVAMLTHK